MVLLGSFSANAVLVSQKHLPFADLMAEKAQMPKLSFLLETWRFNPADHQSLKTFPQFPCDSSSPRGAPGELCPHLPVWPWCLRALLTHSWLRGSLAPPAQSNSSWQGWSRESLGSSTPDLTSQQGHELQLSEATFQQVSMNTHSMCCTDYSSPLPSVRDIPGSSQKQRQSLLSAFCFQQRQLCSPRNGPVRHCRPVLVLLQFPLNMFQVPRQSL